MGESRCCSSTCEDFGTDMDHRKTNIKIITYPATNLPPNDLLTGRRLPLQTFGLSVWVLAYQ